ncbi:10-formyltetrahydrofolate synthetase [Perilla frutescens var. hirtella]|nr:10-formyltetrahydrofolate synthetase [Perilla frutescens var. hirtella]
MRKTMRKLEVVSPVLVDIDITGYGLEQGAIHGHVPELQQRRLRGECVRQLLQRENERATMTDAGIGWKWKKQN